MNIPSRARHMKPLKTCCNGCQKPVHPPSEVLCESCFKELDRKMRDLPSQMNAFEARAREVKKAGKR